MPLPYAERDVGEDDGTQDGPPLPRGVKRGRGRPRKNWGDSPPGGPAKVDDRIGGPPRRGKLPPQRKRGGISAVTRRHAAGLYGGMGELEEGEEDVDASFGAQLDMVAEASRAYKKRR